MRFMIMVKANPDREAGVRPGIAGDRDLHVRNGDT